MRFLLFFVLLAAPALAQDDDAYVVRLPSPEAKHTNVPPPSEEAPPAVPTDTRPEPNVITLQGLNKVTARSFTLTGPIGQPIEFGALEITPKRCWRSLPEDRPENAALLDISESKPGESSAQVFFGWMFSSSPGLSGLEHPVYDITLVNCDHKEEEKKDKEKDKR